MQTGLVYLRNAASLLTSRCSRSKRIVDFNMFRVAVAFSVIFLYFSCASLRTTHIGLLLYVIEMYFVSQSSLNNRDSDIQKMYCFFSRNTP